LAVNRITQSKASAKPKTLRALSLNLIASASGKIAPREKV
jgi:hypothetical protein